MSDEKIVLERRLHAALQAAWPHVNKPFTSNSAKNEVGRFATASFVEGQYLPMVFALQTAWAFVHDSGDDKLLAECRELLGHGQSIYYNPPQASEAAGHA